MFNGGFSRIIVSEYKVGVMILNDEVAAIVDVRFEAVKIKSVVNVNR